MGDVMVREYLFDDWCLVFYVFFGFVLVFFLVWSLVVLVMFILYEISELEKLVVILGDVVEFLVGYIYGLVVVVWLVLGFYV